MPTDVSTTRAAQLTRPSGLGAVGWLLPVVMLVPAVLLCAVAVHELDRLYERDAGVVRAEQLVPYPLVLRYGDIAHDDPVSSARLERARARWDDAAARAADRAAGIAWREPDGHRVVVTMLVDDHPGAAARAVRAAAVPRESVRSWLEGDRVAVVLAVRPPRTGRVTTGRPATGKATAALLTERADAVRRSVTLLRAASLTAGAVLPVVAVATLLLAAVVVMAVVLLPALLVWSWVARLRAGGRAGLLARAKERTRRAGAVRPVPLPSGAELLVLPGWRRPGHVGWLRTVPLAVVALPAATRSLWPGSLVWAGVLALLVVQSMSWAAGSIVVRWLRRVLYLMLVLGLSHALFGWPAAPAGDRRVLGALAAVAALTGILALSRRRALSNQVGGGLLGLRWLLFLVGFVVVAAASVALFLGSNGALDVRAQLRAKALAVVGLLLLPLVARRLRAARELALRSRLRRAGAPEVLYLRSFDDDRLRVRSARRAREGYERWLPWPNERFEDVLLRGFARIGPVVAIARPGTEQTELGAARDLVVGTDWVTAVEHEIDDARFVTVVLGRGAGLHTELVTLAERQRLDRVCVVVPPVAPDEVAERLTTGTRALGPDAGWGDVTGDAIEDRGEVVALVGIGDRRIVTVAPRRAAASTYLALAATVATLLDESGSTGADTNANDSIGTEGVQP
jgi:hypothetical protein